MDGTPLFWGCQQVGADDLQQKLYWTALELENVKIKAEEEMKKKEENAKQILQLLMHQKHLFQQMQIITQERDEARDQVQKLLQGLVPIEASLMTSHLPHENPLGRLPTIGDNSCITELDSLSDTYKNRPHPHAASSSSCSSATAVGPPMDSAPDVASSPNLWNIDHLAGSNNTVTSGKGTGVSMPVALPSGQTGCDRASMVLDHVLSDGKPLPEKGKLLQAVQEAGPLLKTLLLAGPLPRWRNPPPPPPPPLQPVETPPEYDAGVLLNAGGVGSVHDYSSAFPLAGSFGTPQVYAASAVSSTGQWGSSSSCVRQRPPRSPCVVSEHHRSYSGKRHHSA